MRKPKQTHGLTNLGTGPRKRGRIPHADDFAVDDFAHVMKGKLAQKRDEGRGGWENKEGCSAEFLSHLLREHVDKGDPVDVANFCMMLQQRGERISSLVFTDAMVEAALDAFVTEGGQSEPIVMDRPHSISFQSQLKRMRSALSASQPTSREGESRG